MKKIVMSLTALSLILTPVTLNAADGHKSKMKKDHKERMYEMMKSKNAKKFNSMDQNSDGKVDMNEFQMHAKTMFNEIDADSNGNISEEELMMHHTKKSKSKMKKNKEKKSK